MDDRGVAEADVDRGRPSLAVERAVERGTAVLARLLRAGLHVRLVDLHDVRAGREEVGDLVVDGGGVGLGSSASLVVVVVLSLLGHRERAREGHLDLAVGVRLRNSRSPTWTGCLRSIVPTTRGTGLGWPLRSSAVPGLSRSMPVRALAKRLE